MVYHDLYLPLTIGLIGLIAGIYILSKVRKLSSDRVLVFDFILMGIVHMYIGVVYLLFLFNIIEGSLLSSLVRPAILLQLGLPAMITWRMGVRT